jgi:nitroimidazol reductase NimA-like FMN-containing flavoprotein (pyridoxamine 5'-phosphate oxidase superfamily)
MTDNAALEQTVRDLLASDGVAVLSTQGEDFPHVCLVAFAVTEDLRTIVFVTSRSTRKYANIQREGRVTLLVDNRSNTEEDFHRATVVTGQGKAAEVSPAERENLIDLYLRRHPYLENFVRSPTSVLMRIKVSTYAVVSRFQNVLLLNMDHDPAD